MTDGWEKAKRIFADAIKFAPAERLHFLDEVCEGDADTRREVESLLASFDDAGGFMEKPAVGEVAGDIRQTKHLEKGRCFGHYEIIKQLGVGGMGEVYLAEDKKLDRRVAIKILTEKFAKHESNLQRFTQEAKAASALNHPNILVIHEIGEAEDANYIVSEYIEGKTLREVFKESPMKLSEVLDIAIQIANALVVAHAANIVHRDIKPENIMIRPDGYVKILDFGLAKLVEQKKIGFEDSTIQQNQTAKGVILGTVNYMSPEQAKGERVDLLTDVFSFGVLLYEIIAGRTPFASATMSETFANLINAEPQPLARYAANVPEELQRIVTKTLRKNKTERYQTMQDLLTDLKNLRENLAFDERLEKSHSLNDKNATAVLQAMAGDGNQQTNETDNNFTGRIKRRRPLAALFALLLVGAIGFGYYYFFWSSNKPASNTAAKKSLAVLPFVNAGNDPNAEYLSDGITESIINNLSLLSNLRVMSRNSAFRFKNNQTDTQNIAAQLGVETLVTGDIKQLGDKLIINVRLIDPSDDSQIWGNQYVKTSADIIAAQNEIAQAVANNLRLKLSNAEQQQLRKSYTENAKANEFYQRGRYHYYKLTEPEIRKSIGFYQQAIEADPNYALAYAGIADAYRTLPISGYASSKEAFPQAKAAAERALEIDPQLAEAYIVLGWIGFWFDWDWTGAESRLKTAIELSPNSPDAHRAYAHFLSNLERHDEAVVEGRRARELDPLTLITNALEGQFLFYAGRDAEAIDRFNKTLEIEPNFWIAHNGLGRVYIRQGRYAEAIAALNKAIELSGSGSTEPMTQLGYALAKSGNRERANATIAELKSRAAEDFVPTYNFAMIYNGLGEKEEALNYLEKSFQEREAQISFIKVDTRWNNLRNEPRFVEIVKRMNLE